MTDAKPNNEDGNGTKKKCSTSDVSEAQKELAQTALNEFNKSNYSGTLSSLNKLLNARPKDIKVQLNKAVAEYYKSSLKKTDIFLKNLNEICNQAGIKLEKVQPSDEADASVIRLNYCIVLFYHLQYRSAASILEKMYDVLESLDESVSISLSLLLIECYLGMSQPAKALELVRKTEATFLPKPLPPATSTKPLPIEKETKSPDKSIERDIGPAGSSNQIISSGTNIIPTENEPIIGNVEVRGTADQESLREKLQLLQMRALLDMRMLKLAKKEIKVVVNHAAASGTLQNLTLIMIKGCMEYLKGAPKRSIKIINQCATISNHEMFFPRMPVAYYNNLSVLHMEMGKPTLAAIYIRKAHDELMTLSKPKDKSDVVSLNTVGTSICSAVHYNSGLSYLKTGNLELAFDSFVEAAQIHCTNSRVWLRLAEACTLIHRKKMETQDAEQPIVYKTSASQKPILQLFNGPCYDKKLSEQFNATSAALPIPTLEFARLCLRNCMYLIPMDIPCGDPEDPENPGYVPQLYEASPSVPMRRSQLLDVKIYCLLNSAFISLCLGDYHVALQDSKELLDIVKKEQGDFANCKFLANTYCAEALIKLGQPLEAVWYLSGKQNSDLDEIACENWLTSNKEPSLQLSPCRVLEYNMTVAYALDRQYQEAFSLYKEMLSKLPDKIPTPVYVLGFYIARHLGMEDMAQALLVKQLESMNKF